MVANDLNPAVGSGVPYATVLFTFDANNNSIIEDMQTKQTINVVKLTDPDEEDEKNQVMLMTVPNYQGTSTITVTSNALYVKK